MTAEPKKEERREPKKEFQRKTRVPGKLEREEAGDQSRKLLLHQIRKRQS